MQPVPYHYSVTALGGPCGDICLDSRRLERLHSSPPAEFGGRGDRWSPETLLTAAVADGFVLTFRAVATASRVGWIALQMEADGIVARVHRTMQFTRFDLRARLRVPSETNVDRARHALEKAERNCLISNSLKATIHLEIDVEVSVQPGGRPGVEHPSTP